MKTLLSELCLVFPPLSNQEGDWLWKDHEVREAVSTSKIYMLAHRKELFFVDANILFDGFGFITFKLRLDNILSPLIKVSIKFVIESIFKNNTEVLLEFGDKLIRIKNAVTNEVVYWTTPDKFLFDYSRGHIEVIADKNFDYRQFSTFELYYVGISKEGNSFSRLFKNGHHARTGILSNETQKEQTARLTDELMIFLFEVDSVNINTINVENEISDLFYQSDEIAIIADAEKAFISLLDTKYNKEKYKNYPKGKDGLSDTGLTRYGYTIGEDVTFKTDTVDFNGAYGLEKHKDLILIAGEDVEIVTHRS